MKRFSKLALLALVAGVMAPAANALADAHEGKFKVHGEVRVRGEYLSNITDAEDHDQSGDSDDDDFDFWPYRVRLGVTGQFTNDVVGHIEIQNVGVFGGDPFGPFHSADDPLLQAFRNDFINSETTLYQGFIDLKNLGANDTLSLRFGRAEHTLGNELLIGDLDFYGGIAFDGARAMFDFEEWDLDLFYYRITEGNLSVNASGFGDQDVHFAGAHAAFDLSDNGQALTPYILYKRDGRGSSGISGIFDQHQFYTLGALYERPVNGRDDVDDGRHWDWSAEAAIQTGDYGNNIGSDGFCPSGDCDIAGSIFEGWIGYNWELGDEATQRVHLGAFVSSGDDDSSDEDFDAFIPLYGDIHENNRLGNADLFGILGASSFVGSFPLGFSNLTSINAGYTIDGTTHDFMVAVHQFTTTEEFDVGGGQMEDDLGMEFDFEYGYNYSPNVDFLANISLFQPGDLIDAFVFGQDADDITRVYGQIRLRF